MKTLGLALILVGATFAILPATAQDACSTSFSIVGRDDNMWHVGGETNPTLTACPGQEITISATGEGTNLHNIIVTGIDNAPSAIDVNPDETVEYTFTAPESGSGEYVCQYHSSTMKGTITFAETASNGGGNGGGENTNDTPGVATLGVLLALVGAALIVARRKA